MKYSSISLLVGTVFLSACSENAPITNPPVELTIKQANTSSRIVGYTEPVVRTFLSEGTSDNTTKSDSNNSNSSSTVQNAGKKEVTGAVCKLDSAEMSASFTTPARVRVPKFKGKPTTIRMVCTADNLKSDYTFRPKLDGQSSAAPPLLV